MRHAALLLLLCSCSSLSSEQRDQLAAYQRRAKLYFDGNSLEQALDQAQRGLELDPDDYLLNTLYGAILLRASGPSLGSDHRALDRATGILERTYEERSASRHEPYLLFYYALALQMQGRRHLGEADRLTAVRAQGADEPPSPAAIDELRQRREGEFAAAEELFATLIERGDLMRLCHHQLLLAAHDRRLDDALERHARDYLPIVAEEQAFHDAEIQRTAVPGYEQEQKILLAQLRKEELDVRSLLAEHYYAKADYATALTMLDRVLEIDPKRSVDYYNRGRVLLHLGRDDDAKADFSKFLATTDLPPTSDKAVFAAATLAK